MRKSGHRAGGRSGLGWDWSVVVVAVLAVVDDSDSDRGTVRNCLPNRRSHSGPERYVIVAISKQENEYW